MANWALAAEQKRDSKWSWPPRRVPTRQNKKVWRDCICGTFIKGLDDLLDPVTRAKHNCVGYTSFLPFNYGDMLKGSSLMNTIRQYPSELLYLLGGVIIPDLVGSELMDNI